MEQPKDAAGAPVHSIVRRRLEDELHRLKQSHAKLSQQVKEARNVIMLYRRWEHASDVEIETGDEADTSTMLIEASFAAQDFVDTWENKIGVSGENSNPSADREKCLFCDERRPSVPGPASPHPQYICIKHSHLRKKTEWA